MECDLVIYMFSLVELLLWYILRGNLLYIFFLIKVFFIVFNFFYRVKDDVKKVNVIDLVYV